MVAAVPAPAVVMLFLVLQLQLHGAAVITFPLDGVRHRTWCWEQELCRRRYPAIRPCFGRPL